MSSEREALRQAARRARKKMAAMADGAGRRLAEQFLADVPWSSHRVVAGYWPVGSEVDDRPLLEALHDRGCELALPCTVGADKPLLFRRWSPGDALVDGRFAIPEPTASTPLCRPSLVLVPLLAVDDVGHRLGSGHGYYDRTLAELRGEGTILAVGVGFAAQRMGRLPSLATDQRLDWLVTEEGAESFT